MNGWGKLVTAKLVFRNPECRDGSLTIMVYGSQACYEDVDKTVEIIKKSVGEEFLFQIETRTTDDSEKIISTMTEVENCDDWSCKHNRHLKCMVGKMNVNEYGMCAKNEIDLKDLHQKTVRRQSRGMT